MMPRPDPPEPSIPAESAGGVGPAHVALWFIVHRVLDDTLRAACYVCGYWSEPAATDGQAQALLRAHVATAEHIELAGPYPDPRLTIDERA